MQNNDSIDVQVGSEEEMELIDKKLGEFNGQQVPFTQKLDANNEPVLVKKNYVIKENGELIAGIKSFIYGALDDCPPGHKRYHLKKVLKRL